jgi:hypothetical protein
MTHLPAHIANRQRKPILAAVSAGLGSASPPYVSIKGGSFTLIDANGEQEPIDSKFLDCVIFDVNETVAIQRVYWGKDRPFDPNSDTYQAPVCFSDNGVGASVNAQQPQSSSCQTCPQNVWGSATSRVSGKATKACGQIKKIVVLVSGYDMPFLLRVPVMSHDNLRVYGDKFKGQQFDVSDIYTRISFVHGQVGQLDFNPIPSNAPWVSEADAKKIDDFLARKVTDALVGRGDTPVQGQIATQPAAVQNLAYQQPAVAQPQAQPVPQQSVFGTAPAEAAKPKRTRKAAEPAQAQPDDNIPPFLRRQAETVQATPTQKNTGIVNDAPPPNDELQAALNNVFGLPT